MADPENKLPAITFWLLGSLSTASWQNVLTTGPLIVLGSVALLLVRWRINLLAMGDEEARALGVRIERLKAIIIVASTLATAAAGRERPLSALVQVSIDGDPARGGALPGSADQGVGLEAVAEAVADSPTMRLAGLMAVAPLIEVPEVVRKSYQQFWAELSKMGFSAV